MCPGLFDYFNASRELRKSYIIQLNFGRSLRSFHLELVEYSVLTACISNYLQQLRYSFIRVWLTREWKFRYSFDK